MWSLGGVLQSCFVMSLIQGRESQSEVGTAPGEGFWRGSRWRMLRRHLVIKQSKQQAEWRQCLPGFDTETTTIASPALYIKIRLLLLFAQPLSPAFKILE
ncbi:hypothetical protein CHARACLAT_024494 [Characodon lateralis]|uniref:Secreted protein n=1 Tax=Characodon lateralis TaxID=208331 RepID=A0ABU7CQZ7_9TELE|nr:hypothetical protein [Characodon lateralis]